MLSAEILTNLLNIEVAHALYQEQGRWYHVLNRFPGALFDRNGFVIIKTKHEYDSNPNLKSGKELNIAGGIANLPGYRVYTVEERRKINDFANKKIIDEPAAWALFLQNAQEYFNKQEVFLSPFYQQRYIIDNVSVNSIRIKRLDATNSSETMGRQRFRTCIQRINKNAFPIAKGSIYEHVAEEVTLVALLPMLDWSEDGHFIVYVEEEIHEISMPVRFEAPNDDISKRIQVFLKRRLGQKKLRDKLFYEYDGKCAISNCAIKEVLHACHVIPFAKSGNNLSTNAILLRSDLHDLFDANLLAIHPITHKIFLHHSVKLYYEGLNETINMRVDNKPLDQFGLEQRWELFQL